MFLFLSIDFQTVFLKRVSELNIVLNKSTSLPDSNTLYPFTVLYFFAKNGCNLHDSMHLAIIRGTMAFVGDYQSSL